MRPRLSGSSVGLRVVPQVEGGKEVRVVHRLDEVNGPAPGGAVGALLLRQDPAEECLACSAQDEGGWTSSKAAAGEKRIVASQPEIIS